MIIIIMLSGCYGTKTILEDAVEPVAVDSTNIFASVFTLPIITVVYKLENGNWPNRVDIQDQLNNSEELNVKDFPICNLSINDQSITYSYFYKNDISRECLEPFQIGINRLLDTKDECYRLTEYILLGEIHGNLGQKVEVSNLNIEQKDPLCKKQLDQHKNRLIRNNIT